MGFSPGLRAGPDDLSFLLDFFLPFGDKNSQFDVDKVHKDDGRSLGRAH